ncbi:methyltransferase domain-containing protein [Oricola sp.]|uniref:class I SAM-dependent methyltransferase n=1 Tax=Oricola sp. TaxID=1979950 RepID=UPI0025FF16C4|nr:methyltransferase domain-containing protein [Oricola sp.]MCI5077782.1 methyltransferase domain-containing protein [Oricola sp.]
MSRKAVIKARFADQVRFFGSLLRAPRAVGAIAPTSSETAQLMASHITTASDLPVLELGPGTGAITAAILATGIAPGRLFAVEYSAAFCRLLNEKFAGAQFLQGDAFDLDATLRAHLGDAAPERFDCVISGLPLLNFPKEKRVQLLHAALSVLEPGRPFVQFSYGLIPPIDIAEPGIAVTRSRWIVRNVPPARVWVYRRRA